MGHCAHRSISATAAGGVPRRLAARAWPAVLLTAVAIGSLAFGNLPAQQPLIPGPAGHNPAAHDPAIQPLPPPAHDPHRPPEQPLLLQRETLQVSPARLEDFEQTALNSHPQIISAAQAVGVAEGKAWQARLYPNPMVGVGAPQLGGSESQYTAFLSQDILTGKKKRLDQAAACQEVEQARLALTRARFEVLTAVRQRFFEALAAQNRVAVQNDLARIAQRSKELGDALFKGGEGTKTDTLLLDVELIQAQIAQTNSQTTLDALKRRLAAAAGMPGLPIDTLYGDLAAETFQIDFDRAQEEAAFLNAQAGIAQSEAERARILLRRAIVEPYPTFNAMGGYMRQLEGVENMGMFQITMTLPVWNRNQGGKAAALAYVGQTEADIRRVQIELSGQAAEAVGRYRAAVALVERYQKDILPKTRETVELTQRLYEQNQIDFLRLLSAQRKLSEVNLGYIDAHAARWDAAADLGNLLQMEQFP